MDKVNIGESTLKDFGDVINEAADILNKGKVAFDNTIPDKTLQVLPYTGQAGAIIPSKIGDLADLTTTAKDNLVNAINEVNDSLKDIGDIDTTNLAKLNGHNTFTGTNTFNQHIIAQNISHTNAVYITGYEDSPNRSSLQLDEFGADIGTPNRLLFNVGTDFICNASGNVELNPEGNLYLGGNNRHNQGIAIEIGNSGSLYMGNKAKSEFQRVLEIPDTSNLVDLSSNQTINGVKRFTNDIKVNNLSIGTGATGGHCHISSGNNNIDIYTTGSGTLRMHTISTDIDMFSTHGNIAINTSTGRLSISSGDTMSISSGGDMSFILGGTLFMNTKMISELKRLLGIQ